MIRHCWDSHLLLLALIVAFTLFAAVGCSQAALSYQMKPDPSDKIVIVGTVPKGIAIELTVFWQTTVVNDECAPKQPWPVGVRSPKQMNFPVRMERRSEDQVDWITWRDLLIPETCGWRLSSIEFKADRSKAELVAHTNASLWSRIAFVCLTDCVANSVRINDDDAKPVHLYCRFSILRRNDSKWNPCVFGSDASAKSQHILRSEQHAVRFSLTDLES